MQGLTDLFIEPEKKSPHEVFATYGHSASRPNNDHYTDSHFSWESKIQFGVYASNTSVPLNQGYQTITHQQKTRKITITQKLKDVA